MVGGTQEAASIEGGGDAVTDCLLIEYFIVIDSGARVSRGGGGRRIINSLEEELRMKLFAFYNFALAAFVAHVLTKKRRTFSVPQRGRSGDLFN